jgi:PqqD family protein of HPr-rel-A system
VSASVGLPTATSLAVTAELGDELVVFNPVDATIHVLSPTAALVWEACVEGGDAGELARALADAAGREVRVVTDQVDRCLAQFVAAGLVGTIAAMATQAPTWLAEPWRRIEPFGHRTRTMRVLDDDVVVCTDDASLLRRLHRLLASLPDGDHRAEPVVVALTGADGSWRVQGPGLDVTRSTVDEAIDLVPSALNQIAASSSSVLALHAGAVRHPSGGIAVLPGVSGSGKSTLVATLVRAGWDYVSDEAVGIRSGSLGVVGYPKPLSLAPAARAQVGLGVALDEHTQVSELRPGAVARAPLDPPRLIVLPTYRAGAAPAIDLLAPDRAVTAIAEHALNLRRVGVGGLEALVALAATVPTFELVHGDGAAVVPALEALVR